MFLWHSNITVAVLQDIKHLSSFFCSKEGNLLDNWFLKVDSMDVELEVLNN